MSFDSDALTLSTRDIFWMWLRYAAALLNIERCTHHSPNCFRHGIFFFRLKEADRDPAPGEGGAVATIFV